MVCGVSPLIASVLLVSFLDAAIDISCVKYVLESDFVTDVSSSSSSISKLSLAEYLLLPVMNTGYCPSKYHPYLLLLLLHLML